jgi:hypothetical protein
VSSPPEQFKPRQTRAEVDLKEERRARSARLLQDARLRLQVAMMASGLVRPINPALTLCVHGASWTACAKCSTVRP